MIKQYIPDMMSRFFAKTASFNGEKDHSHWSGSAIEYNFLPFRSLLVRFAQEHTIKYQFQSFRSAGGFDVNLYFNIRTLKILDMFD